MAVDWDPKHLVVTGLVEDGCQLTVWGVADDQTDVSELAKRFKLSVFFGGLVPVSTEAMPAGGFSFVFAGPPLR